jgi:hypothetical protein
VLPQNLSGQDRAFFGVAGPAVQQVLFLPADIVEQCGEPEDVEVSLLFAADAEAKPVNPLRMIPVVAPPGAAEKPLGFLPNCLENLRRKAHIHINPIDSIYLSPAGCTIITPDQEDSRPGFISGGMPAVSVHRTGEGLP